MQIELEPEELDSILEGLDCLKTKIAFVKGATYAEKTARLATVEALEQKVRRAKGESG